MRSLDDQQVPLRSVADRNVLVVRSWKHFTVLSTAAGQSPGQSEGGGRSHRLL